MTTGIAGRKIRIKYDSDGAGAGTSVVIARATADSWEQSNSRIDITSKDDNGRATALNDVGLQECKLSCSGILAALPLHRSLATLANSAGEGTALHFFELDAPGVGVYRGQWFIDSWKLGGDAPDGSATFEMALSSSGVIAFTAAT